MIDKGTSEDRLEIIRRIAKAHCTGSTLDRLRSGLLDILDVVRVPDGSYVLDLARYPNPTLSSPTDTARVDWLEKVEAGVFWNTRAEDDGTDFWSFEHVTGVKTIREFIDAEIEKEAGRG